MKTLMIVLLLISPLVSAQEDTEAAASKPAPPPAPPTCDSEKHRQFDFWVGDWDVTANGQPAGHNLITLEHGDCALQEHWTSATSAFTGGSFNIYDRANDKWHQTWVDSTGTLLELDGGFKDGKMVLSGQRPGPDGKMKTHRITFTPNEDGSVRQHWQVSSDGEEWSTLFDGHYVRAKATE